MAQRSREEVAVRSDKLRAEKAEIERSLRQQAQAMAALFEEPNAAARLADLQDQTRAAENRLSQIAIELNTLGDGNIDDDEVGAALGRLVEL